MTKPKNKMNAELRYNLSHLAPKQLRNFAPHLDRPDKQHHLVVVVLASGVGREVTDPGGGAEVEAFGTVELDRAGVIADVENITVIVVGQESGGGVFGDCGAVAGRRALLGDGGSEGAAGSGQKGDDGGELHFGGFWKVLGGRRVDT
jgi:hypothetical protein